MLFAAIIAALSFTSCDNDSIVDTTLEKPSDVKVDIQVADLGQATKAVKTSWNNGDKLNIWFDQAYWNVAPQLVMTYDGSKWNSSSVNPSVLHSSGTLKVIYEASNSLFNSVIDGSNACFPGDYLNGYSAHVSCYSNYIPYTFSAGNLTATISEWKFLSQLQVVITGLPKSADNYSLEIDNIQCIEGFMFSVQPIFPKYSFYATRGVMNDDGVAFCFGSNCDTSNRDITFYLTDKETGSVYYYMKGNTSLPLSENSLKAIKIDASKFTTTPTKVYEYVDLGLSVKWATMNVGATRPEEYGDYFAWGETEPYYEAGYAQEDPQNHWKAGKTYNWSTYKYGSNWDELTKYSTDADYGRCDMIDVLESEDDAAHVNWGSSWRMPTKGEQDELCEKCTWTWTTLNGVYGYKVTSNIPGYTDKWIFLPVAGYRSGSDLYSVGSDGGYWSRSLSESTPEYALGISFNSDVLRGLVGNRYVGYSVRPVRP